MPNITAWDVLLEADSRPKKKCSICNTEGYDTSWESFLVARCTACNKLVCQACHGAGKRTSASAWYCKECAATHLSMCRCSCITTTTDIKPCTTCGLSSCYNCSHSCYKCGKSQCSQCAKTCQCGARCCKDHIFKCDNPVCAYGEVRCLNCTCTCGTCGKKNCAHCAKRCRYCNRNFCRYSNCYNTSLNCCTSCTPQVIEQRRVEELRREQEIAHERARREEEERKEREDGTNIILAPCSSAPYFPTRTSGNSAIDFARPLTECQPYSVKPDNWPFFKQDWEGSALYLGMEWELNFDHHDSCTVKRIVEKHLHGSYIWKSDGSIGEGQELVLAPRTLQSYRDINLHLLCKELKEANATGFQRNSCGIHIHVNRDAIKNTDMRKIMAWVMVNRKFIRRFSKRTISQINSWASIPYSLEEWYSGNLTRDGNRHIAINRTKETWEFRFFRSTVRYERVKATLHFVEALVTFARHNSFALCAGKHSLTEFILWLKDSKEHQFLYNYIITEPKLLTIPKKLDRGRANLPRILDIEYATLNPSEPSAEAGF